MTQNSLGDAFSRETLGFKVARFTAACALLLASACTKPVAPRLPIDKPLFSFDDETVTALTIHRRDPNLGAPWSAQFVRNGWLGPEQVTPRWVVQQAPEGLQLQDSLADGNFIRHLLDSLRGLRKAADTNDGNDASFGLAPAWTELQWRSGDRTMELRIGAPLSNGSAYARVGDERLIVRGATLELLSFVTGFQKFRHQRLLTWLLDDADRVSIVWKKSGKTSKQWSAERSTGDWVNTKTQAAFRKSPQPALDRITHLVIEKFEDATKDATKNFSEAWVTLTLLDRQERKLTVEISPDLLARSSDRPNMTFQLHEGARQALAEKEF